MWGRIKKILKKKDNKPTSPKATSSQGIPKEIMDKLPPGVKIKRIEIGPAQIMKTLISLLMFYIIGSALITGLVGDKLAKVPLSRVIESIKKNEVKEITVMDNEILVTLKDPTSPEATTGQAKILVASKESNVSMSEIMQREGVDMSSVSFNVENRSGWKAIGEILGTLLGIGIPILFILWFFNRQSGAQGGGMFGFGKSTAKLFIKGKQNITFKDVAGVEEAKRDLEEVVDFLKHPEKYQKMGSQGLQEEFCW